MKRGHLPLLAFLLLCLSCASFGAKDYRKGDLDAWIPQLMKSRGITGLSIAVIDGGKIVKARGYGLGDVASRRLVDESTLFQAASISKSVTALGATSSSFTALMNAHVLEPLGMEHSSFLEPLPLEFAAGAATGHGTSGRAVAGRWHVYPELAAAGLWTTPSDLARFIIGIQQALAGQPGAIVSQATARMMITEVKDGCSWGLGLRIKPGSGDTFFAHGGRNEGFDSFLAGLANAGKGVVIMIDRNDDSGAITEVRRAIEKEYDWDKAGK